MSFTPRGIDVSTGGYVRYHPRCCVGKHRRCGAMAFRYPMTHPRWFTCPPKCPPVRRPLIRRGANQYELMYDDMRGNLDPKYEHMLEPYLAFWHYSDIVPDPLMSPRRDRCCQAPTPVFDKRPVIDTPCDHVVPDPRDCCPPDQFVSKVVKRKPTGGAGRWPPLECGVCPPPIECDPCGPGPYADPEIRRFFFMDCV